MLPDSYLRKAFSVQTAQIREQLGEKIAPAAEDFKDSMEWTFLREMEYLYSLPDALFFSPEGAFFMEVEISPKPKRLYRKIFKFLKPTGLFVLYLIKDRCPHDIAPNAEEWTATCKVLSAEDRHGPRMLKKLREIRRKNKWKQPRTKSIPDNQVNEWYNDSTLDKHVAFIRLDREEYVYRDCEEAARRIRRHLALRPLYCDGELVGLYQNLKHVFSGTAVPKARFMERILEDARIILAEDALLPSSSVIPGPVNDEVIEDDDP